MNHLNLKRLTAILGSLAGVALAFGFLQPNQAQAVTAAIAGIAAAYMPSHQPKRKTKTPNPPGNV